MNLHACLTDPRQYERQIERLHQKYLWTRRLYELQQSDVSLASFVLNRSTVARRIARTVGRGEYRLEPAHVRTITTDGKQRVVFAYRLTDLLVHGVVASILEEALTPALSHSLYSYRKGVSWWSAISAFATYTRTHRKTQPEVQRRGLYVIRRDIDSYTDSIPVGATSPVWDMLRGVLRAFDDGPQLPPAHWHLIESVVRPEAFVTEGQLFTQYRGVPTGQPISCVLFNLYLSGLDAQLDRIPGAFYARYCDDIVFAHPDPDVVCAADARIQATLSALAIQLNEGKSRSLYLTAAGRQSSAWPEARGTTEVPLLGCLVSAQGTVSLSRKKRRRLLADIEDRAFGTARALKTTNRQAAGRIICSVINRALEPRLEFSQQRSATLLRRAVTDRDDLKQLDYCIARIVLRAITGQRGARAFRLIPYRTMREEWQLISLLQARNKWPAQGGGAIRPRHMTPIDSWLHRQAEREKRLITLEDALLGNQARAYALYRLRYFALRCVSSAVLHGIRLTLLQYIFSHQAFLTTLLLNAVAGLVTSFWWGALEVLRARVRHLSHDAQRHRIPEEIGQWLTVAAVLAVTSLLLPAGWIVWECAYRQRAFDVLQLYTFAIGFRVAADFVTLMFHSGVYAVRRVYRPMPAMVAVELVSMLAVLALWPWLGRWSFPIAVLLGTAVSAGLVVHYCARLYRLLGWLPLRLSKPQRSQFARWSTVAEFLAAGLSYALMKLDAFLMLAMFHSRVPAANGVSLFVFFVSIGPAIQAGFDWAQLLYFDLKKLNTRCLRAFRQRYERSAFHLAWVVGVVLWGFACVLGTAITRCNLGALYWLIGPFFLARSFLALAQIQAFSARRYRALLTSGALLLAFMVALQVGMPSERDKVLGLAFVSFLVAGLVRMRAHAATDEVFERRVLPVTDWLERLKQVREPVRLRSLSFRTEARPHLGPMTGGRTWADDERWKLRRMAQRVAKNIRGRGAVTMLHPGQVAWYETARAGTPIKRHTLLRWGGGLIHSITSTHLERDGASALRAGLMVHVLGGPFGNVRRLGSNPIPIQEVKRAFAEMVPHGVMYSPDDPIPEMLKTLSSWDRRRILFEGVQFAWHLHGTPGPGRFDVTSFCSAGELKLIFIIDRRYDRRQRMRWRARIRAINVAAALQGSHQPSALTRQQEKMNEGISGVLGGGRHRTKESPRAGAAD